MNFLNNKRKYPKNMLSKFLYSWQERIKQNDSFGKINHPSPQIINYPTSNESKVKKAITEKDLEEGEMICSKCKGVGFLKKIKSENISIYKDVCPKCHGAGKLDWIENVIGKKPSNNSSSSTSGMSSKSLTINWNGVGSGDHGYSDLKGVMIKQVAEQMAKKIDEEILEMIKKGG